MWRYRPTFGFVGRWVYVTRGEWLDALTSGLFKPKAPKSWVAEQAMQGRPPVAAFSIWAKYPLDRKWTIWSLASDDDARAAGYVG